MKSGLSVISCLVLFTNAANALDFPMASCKGWDGTVTKIVGANTPYAEMHGKITQSNLAEYCFRMNQPDTNQINKCMEENLHVEKVATVYSQADCDAGTIKFNYQVGNLKIDRKANFSKKPENISCASGLPPLMEQFRLMCPKSFKAQGMADWL